MSAAERFERYLEPLAAGLGHAYRRAELKGYPTGPVLSLPRKRAEPMAASVDSLHASAIPPASRKLRSIHRAYLIHEGSISESACDHPQRSFISQRACSWRDASSPKSSKGLRHTGERFVEPVVGTRVRQAQCGSEAESRARHGHHCGLIEKEFG